MFDWGSDLFARRRPWPAMSRGVGRRPRPVEGPPPEAQPAEEVAPPPSDETDSKPASVLKKAGWVEAITKFQTEAAIFAEFEIPDSEKHRTQVDFQVLRQKDGKFLPYATVQGHADASGRATSRVAIHKDQADAEVFRIQARHGSAGAWADGKGTDREVTESAEAAFEHKPVSGLHFPKDSSFIVPGYLKVFRELEKAYTGWKKTHPNAKVVVFGHAERDETDPHKLSARRAQIAFAFLIGDFHMWGRIAREERWGIWEQQHMLQALGFYAGVVDGVRGPNTDKAIHAFITWLNENECKSINPMLGLTEEYIRLELYRVYITGPKRAVSIPSGKFRTVSGYPYVGCGAYNRYQGSDGHSGENRRATFLMLSESVSFPVHFPCRSGPGPCDAEAAKEGERAVKGFKCRFYDGLMRGEPASNLNTAGMDETESPSEYSAIVNFSPGIEAARRAILSPKTISTLGKIARRVGIESLTITSTIRYPSQQAEAMYTNLSQGKRLKYAAPGMEVTTVYDECLKLKMSKEKTLEKMIEKISALSREGRRVSKHCVSELEYRALNIVDIGMPKNSVKEFILELAKEPAVEKIFHDIPGMSDEGKVARLAKEPCIHVEIKQ